jgi:hypothetical protein
VWGSVEVIVAPRPSIAGIPRASTAHIAYARTPSTCTTCGGWGDGERVRRDQPPRLVDRHQVVLCQAP